MASKVINMLHTVLCYLKQSFQTAAFSPLSENNYSYLSVFMGTAPLSHGHQDPRAFKSLI